MFVTEFSLWGAALVAFIVLKLRCNAYAKLAGFALLQKGVAHRYKVEHIILGASEVARP